MPPVLGSSDAELPKVFKPFLMLPMEDGIKLHTWAVSPPGSSASSWPVVIDRSPYGQFGTELLAAIYLLFGFVSVGQDIRGTCKSEGQFSLFHTDERDGNQTINWILQQDWCDGRVFQIGGSADGIAALELGLASPDALRAQFIIFATGEAEETFYPGGAYRLALIEKWINGTIFPASAAAATIFTAKAHEGPSAFWNEVEYVDGYVNDTFIHHKFSRIKWPVVMWGGWFDIFLRGNLITFDGIQQLSDPTVRGTHYIVIDPLGHCQQGASYFKGFGHDLILGETGRILWHLSLSCMCFR